MPEIRKDPVFGRWVIIASGRRGRPNEFTNAGDPVNPYHCPFCPGYEEETPPTVYSLPSLDPKSPAKWRLRVVMNKFPALVESVADDHIPDGMYDRMEGMGIHEVVIESPDHNHQLEDMTVEEAADVFKAFIVRINEIKKDPRVEYAMVFKNYGKNAGASLAHPHSQIIAMPMAPIRVVQEIEGAQNYHEENGACVFCDIVGQESEFKKRVVGENSDFLAVTPYASRFSFETWIIPKAHESHFENISADSAAGLADITGTVLKKLRVTMEDLSYNLIIHTMPVKEPGVPYYHWHIEIMPKLSQVAGFEWGTGFYINTVSPEDAASMMNAGKKYKRN